MSIQTDEENFDRMDSKPTADSDKASTPYWYDVAARYPGDQTFDPLPASVDPRPNMECTYFYYFGMSSTNKMRTFLYETSGTKQLPTSDLENQIADAIAGGPKSNSKNIDNVSWNKPSFLAFFFDIPNWEFLGDDGKSQNRALYFLETGYEGNQTDCNETFFEAETVAVKVGSKECRLLVVKNFHFKAAKGADRYKPRVAGDREDHYKFDIFVQIPIEHDSGKKLTLVIDPGGRNTGP